MQGAMGAAVQGAMVEAILANAAGTLTGGRATRSFARGLGLQRTGSPAFRAQRRGFGWRAETGRSAYASAGWGMGWAG
jgi:hypothetical protein